MTINISKKKLAAILVALAVIFPASAYAAVSFNDVNPSSIFKNDIDWMADTGISNGCGGGNFCPADGVSREQMAAFMHRMSGTGTVAPSVNAAQLDGSPASAFGLATGSQEPDVDNWDGTSDIVRSASLAAPTSGLMVATYAVSIEKDVDITSESGAIDVFLTMVASGPGANATTTAIVEINYSASTFGGTTASLALPYNVNAGAHTVEVTISANLGGTELLYVYPDSLTMEFFPGGSAADEFRAGDKTAGAVANR